MNKVLLVILLLFGQMNAFGQTVSDVNMAIVSKDINSLVQYSHKTDLEKYSLYGISSGFNFDEFTYEQVRDLSEKAKDGSATKLFFQDILVQKKKEIINIVETLTLENIAKYFVHFPERKDIVNNYLSSILESNLDKLSFTELYYLQTSMPELCKSQIESEITSRNDEAYALFASKIEEFIDIEHKSSNQLKYMIEQIIWNYFVEGHKQLTSAYSEIPIVPDNASDASYQYLRLVDVCLSPKELQKLLQEEVNKYCKYIVMGRIDYSLAARKDNYREMTYSVPLMKLNINAPISSLWEIGQARADYINGRNNVNSGSGIVSTLFGGLWGLGVKALGDWMAISGLVDNEYNARLKYVKAVHDSLLENYRNYAVTVINGFEKALKENEKLYGKNF